MATSSKYEVFISFRGEDTRNNFVSHLHSELDRKGIRTYLDTENLKQGPELLKAIEESSIAIVVLSTNYGKSRWCLNELVKIMECKKSGLHVFPIFYNIDPSDVRKQKNSFFEAFSVHENNLKDDAETVKIWRKALAEVADLVGEDTRGKNELACIKNIADEILMQLPVKASQFRKFVVGIESRISDVKGSQFRKSVVGIESRISEIKKLMCNKSNEVVFIGLFGMGGIGKTTTARAIFDDCKNEFKGSCFLGDVKQSNNKLKELQEKLLSSVLKKKYEGICDVVEGSSIIQERLQLKKVLIVIDDVDDIEQLNALAKERDWFGSGSVIIITTRDVHLLGDDHIYRYDVQTLPEMEALHLFCIHAFKNDHPPKDYEDLSLQVLKYAGGLPLALKVLGDHVKGGDISFWKDMLSRLKDFPENKIISILEISFDGLNVPQQNIFLHIACFFRGDLEYSVKKRLQILGLHPEEGIDVLVRKSLIFIKVDCIEMHDLLQELGWYVVRQRAQGDVRRYNQLWLRKDIVEVLSNTTVSSEVEGICMDLHDNDVPALLRWETAFRQMNKLSFFELYGSLFEEKCDVDGLQIQSSGQLYNPNLRWFSLSWYPGRSLPQGFCPMNLVHLSLWNSKLEETPDFSHMPKLVELDLSSSFRLIHVHPSLGDHKKIKFVYLSDCSELVDFPKIKRMESLEILDLRRTKIKELPEIYGNLDSLRVLGVSYTAMNGLPTSIVGNATGLQKLQLACQRSYSEEFTSLEVLAGSFPALVSLEITGSGIVRTLDFSHLPFLENLDLSNSDELVEVHASLGVHKRIKSIDLRKCSKLVEFPRIINMSSLEKLDLSFTSLKSFPDIYGNLDSLRNLNVMDTSINGLPTSTVGNATGLRKLELVCRRPYMKEFTSLEVLAGTFPGLVSLEITGSGIVRTLDFSHLPYLENLDLSKSCELVEVHASLGVHKRIKTINLANCSKLVEFPRIIDMSSLEELDLSFTSLKSYPGIYGNLDSLRNLNVMDTSINGLPTSIVGNAIGLRKLELVCRRPYRKEFTSLEVVAGSFPGLVSLEISGSGIVRTLDFSHLPYLKNLDLSKSCELVEVHASLGVHKRITTINLANCSKLVEFPRIIDMSSLEELDLSFTSLKSYPEIYGNADSLRNLNVMDTSINGLPTSIVGNATALQKLELACRWPYNEEFTSLEVLAGSFPGLVSLEITGSGIVRTLDFSHLPYLENLDLSGSEKLAEVHASLGVHKRIKSIKFANCSKLVEFPGIIDMNSLEELDLSFTSLDSFPEMSGNVNRLVKLCLDSTKIKTLPWSIGSASGLEVISMIGCIYLRTLPISFLGPQLLIVDISSGELKCFAENNDETAQALELDSSKRKRGKQLIFSEGMVQLSGLRIYFEHCESLEELPETLLSRVAALIIRECPSLTSWICCKLIDLLDKYQHLCNLQLHPQNDIYPHDFLQAFSEWELVSNMLRKRDDFFKVYVPGYQIPSWFQYPINRRSVTAFLPPLAEWDTDNLKGFVVSGLNAVLSESDDFNTFHTWRKEFHVLIMYIPINNIRDWEEQNECTLFDLASLRYLSTEMEETISRWGFSLVYNDDMVNDVQIEMDYHSDPGGFSSRFRLLRKAKLV